MSQDRPRVVILGGGFGGLTAARALKHAPVAVTLVDRNNHHVFQPLLYQVATSAIEATDVAFALRSLLRRQNNTEVLMSEARSIDPAARLLQLSNGIRLPYDYLILATGAQSSYFGHPEYRAYAPSLKTVRDALEIRYRVLMAFEQAEQETDPAQQQALLTFVVVGAGPTGVELAGAIAELAKHALKQDFRHIDPTRAKVILLERGPHILAMYPANLQAKAVKQLEGLGIVVRTSVAVNAVDDFGVVIGTDRVLARTVLWGAGTAGEAVACGLGTARDGHGRIEVGPTLNPPGLPNVFVIGDAATLVQSGEPVPGVATAAIQTGRYAARAIVKRLQGKPVKPFHYWNKGQLATIGRSRAVAMLPGGVKLWGFPAWLVYLTVHLVYLSGFRTRLRVFLSWIWSYVTWARGARLIPSAADARDFGTPVYSEARPSPGGDEHHPAPPSH